MHTSCRANFSDQLDDDDSEAGYLYISTRASPGPANPRRLLDRLPDDWLEERNGVAAGQSRAAAGSCPGTCASTPAVKKMAKVKNAPTFPAPFLFCLNCGVSYAPRQSEFGKLASLSSEGRSSATTLLSLSAIRSLKTSDLPEQARKLLSFTDNRQDASLQAGHFNDFVEVGLLRGAIYHAVPAPAARRSPA